MREFQNWLLIKLVPSFKLRTSHLYLQQETRTVLSQMFVGFSNVNGFSVVETKHNLQSQGFFLLLCYHGMSGSR